MDIEFGRVNIIKKLDFGENRKSNKKIKIKLCYCNHLINNSYIFMFSEFFRVGRNKL